jgi:hypothetical protein
MHKARHKARIEDWNDARNVEREARTEARSPVNEMQMKSKNEDQTTITLKVTRISKKQHKQLTCTTTAT